MASSAPRMLALMSPMVLLRGASTAHFWPLSSCSAKGMSPLSWAVGSSAAWASPASTSLSTIRGRKLADRLIILMVLQNRASSVLTQLAAVLFHLPRSLTVQPFHLQCAGLLGQQLDQPLALPFIKDFPLLQ